MLLKKLVNFIKSFIIFLLIVSVVYYVYLLEIQIEELSFKIQNLTYLMDVLKIHEIELRNQLLVKDHQIEFLTNTINQLKSDIANLNDLYDLESFKKEALKMNSEEWTDFYLNIVKIIASSVTLILAGHTIKETFFTQIIELKFVDSVNKLMWFVRVANPYEDRKIALYVKQINPDLYEDRAVECIKTLILKTPESLFGEYSDYIHVGLVGASSSSTERIIAASQITEMFSSSGVS